jgi:hypothetical protein
VRLYKKKNPKNENKKGQGHGLLVEKKERMM